MRNVRLEVQVNMAKGSDPDGVAKEAIAAWVEFFFNRGNAPYCGQRDVVTPSGEALIIWESES